MNEILAKVLLYLGIGVGGTTVGGIIVGIVIACVKGLSKRALAKLNVKQIAQDTVNETVGQVKKVVMTHSIQPLVASEIEKVNEKVDARLIEMCERVDKRLDKIVNIFDKFYDYFEDSMVSDDKKKAMKTAIEDAKQECVEIESVIVEETIKADEKSIVDPVEGVKTHAEVVR